MSILRCFLPKVLLIGLLFSVGIFPLVEQEAGTAADPLTADERAFVAAHGPIRYAPDPLFPPFEFLDSSGVASGITPDLLTIMGKKLGVEFRTVAYPTWSDVLEAGKRGKVDLLGTLTRTPEREDFLLFSTPYLSVPYVLFVRQGGVDPKTIEDMVSHRLGVVRNYGINTWLSAEHPNIHPVAVEDAATGLNMVATGQLDALLETLPVGNHIMREKSLSNIRIVPRHMHTLPQHFGVRKGEPLLLSIVQKGLDSLTETERSAAFVRWTGQDFSRPSPAISPLVLNALLILIAAAVLSGAWIVALRRSVRRATQSLRENEAFIYTILDNLPIGIAVNSVDPAVKFIYMNDNFPRFYRVTREALADPDSFWDAVYEEPEFREEIKKRVLDDCASGDPERMHWVDVPITRKGNETTFISAMNTPIPGKQLMISSVWDVTDRKRSEEERKLLQSQLHQAMKMEAVGRLAGGVAHDFNNLLTAIMGNITLALMKLSPSDPAGGLLAEANKAAERSATLTQQLLAFSRKQIIEPKILDLNELINGLRTMLVRLIGENIELKTIPEEGLGVVKVDRGQFEQILVNLAVNARDAMPEGGKLLIETANVALDDEYCARHPYVSPGRFVLLAVSDTGHGMSEEVKKQIFEPFFTTKPKGTGTGLGLATVYGVVKQSDGSIEVYSEVEKGTTFRIYLPRVEGEAARQRESDLPMELLEGTETVLIVEDEEIVRNLCVQILERSGYRVLQASNGGEAIALVKGHVERIDLLMTDVVMPGMDGRELANRMTRIHPEARVLFTSGYTDNAIVHHGVLDEGVSFIGKPYSPSALARKIREVLDKA